MKAWNYKLKSKIPTKKQEKYFVDNLPPKLKQYSEILVEELPITTDWNGKCYDSWFKRLWKFLQGKNGWLD